MMKNMWPSIQANSIYRITKPTPKTEEKVFVPKYVLWTAKEKPISNVGLQTELNNALIKFLKAKA